ncbi:MAG: CpXC domain-containing protein [Saccharofermentans sp.]|nr:CpXC domain-containing protein [Saccharofermentans sp.]
MRIRSCNNCSGRLIFDVEKKGLHCEKCGSVFSVKDYDIDVASIDNETVESIDVNVYTCNACGAEINITNTEASTFCVYCGNPAVVFSRIAQKEKPKVIIPFSITKEKAESLIKDELKKGFLLPGAIKNMKVDNLRGIYVPYYVTRVEYDGSMNISVDESKAENSKQIILKMLKAYATLPWVTTDASDKLNNDISERLEPFNFQEAKKFDEDYLLGFYSDISDSDIYEAAIHARKRAEQAVEEEAYNVVHNMVNLYKTNHFTAVYDKPIRALFPAWFMTFRYKDKPYTVIVNGQTGKVVAGLPWKKNFFVGLTVALGMLIATLTAIPLCVFFDYVNHANENRLAGFIFYTVVFSLVATGFFVVGFRKMRKVVKAIALSTERMLSHYVTKRQKGQ